MMTSALDELFVDSKEVKKRSDKKGDEKNDEQDVTEIWKEVQFQVMVKGS